jgi:hypothetical protein
MVQATETEPAVTDGRDNAGKFSAGNSFGRGNPVARHAQRLRQLFVTAVTEEDIRDIVSKLVAMAKNGDIQAANLLLTRALGKPSTSEVTLPLDDVLTLDEQILALGPVTRENLEQHKALRLAQLQANDKEPMKITAENFDAVKERLKRRIQLLGR